MKVSQRLFDLVEEVRRLEDKQKAEVFKGYRGDYSNGGSLTITVDVRQGFKEATSRLLDSQQLMNGTLVKISEVI